MAAPGRKMFWLHFCIVVGSGDRGCITRAGYGAAAHPCSQFFPVATCGLAMKNPPAAQKAFSPQTIIVKEMPVKLLK